MRTSFRVKHWIDVTLEGSEQFRFKPYRKSTTFTVTWIRVFDGYMELMGTPDHSRSWLGSPNSNVVSRDKYGNHAFTLDEVRVMPYAVTGRILELMSQVHDLDKAFNAQHASSSQ